MSSSDIYSEIALYITRIETECDSLEPAAKLTFIETEIQKACEDIDSNAQRLCMLVDFVAKEKLFSRDHATCREWRKSLGESISSALDFSERHKGVIADLMTKINRAWSVWPCALIGNQHQPRVWSRAILFDLHKLSQAGCGKSEAEALLDQARVDRVGRGCDDRRMGVTRNDWLTKGDVTTALERYRQSTTVKPTDKKRKQRQRGRSKTPTNREKKGKKTPKEPMSNADTSSPDIERGRGGADSLADEESMDGDQWHISQLNSVMSTPSSRKSDLAEAKWDHEAAQSNDCDIELSYTDGTVPGFKERSSKLTQTRVVPSNDLSGAVGTLEDGQWLSSTAVELTLNKLCCAGVRVFDSSFLDGDGSRYSIKQIEDKKLWILPLLRDYHWSLITIEMDSGTASFWDSQAEDVHQREARHIVQSLRQFIHTSEAMMYSSASDWKVVIKKCPQQNNTDDCGVYVIMFAIHQVCGLNLPESIDVGLWRHLSKKLLQSGSLVADVGNEQPTDIAPQDPTLSQDPLNYFKTLGQRRSSDLEDARKQAHHSAHTLKCLERIQEQVVSFHDQKAQTHRETLEAINVHENLISMYSTLGASRRRKSLDELLHTELQNYQKQRVRKEDEVRKLSETVESWKLAVQTCNTVLIRRKSLVNSRQKALEDLLDECKSWSETQKVLVHAIEALQPDMKATIKS